MENLTLPNWTDSMLILLYCLRPAVGFESLSAFVSHDSVTLFFIKTALQPCGSHMVLCISFFKGGGGRGLKFSPGNVLESSAHLVKRSPEIYPSE